MLRKWDASATIAVKNVNTARKFYEGTLGLEPVHDMDEAVTYKSGNSSVLVYESQYAGTNEATAVTWMVDDLERVVRSLTEKGVRFEHYDLPDTTRQGDVHVSGDVKVAWFKDPDGNIISLVNQAIARGQKKGDRTRSTAEPTLA
jgi:catechol 2,3-dioxygenase-like lactoylglutathione lyase family enzyme